MDFCLAFELGGNVEYIKHIVCHAEETIVKDRKRTGPACVLDILRQIANELALDKFYADTQERVNDWIFKFEREYKSGEAIKQEDAEELREDMDKLETLISRELIFRPCFELSRSGALNHKALFETSFKKPSSIFERNIWEKLSSIAKSDFSDAAKCLLVEASTPATMVALRGMEAVVRDYYCYKKGEKCGRKVLGTIIKELRELPDANKKLLEYIDYLRSEKRNLAQHPNKTYSQGEAERVLMEIINAVHDIFSDMQTDQSKTTEEPLKKTFTPTKKQKQRANKK